MMLQPASPAGAPELLSREEARSLADRVLSFAKGVDQARVNITSEWGGNTRFADASITTSGGITNTSVTVVVTIGKRRASSATNVLDDASLKRTVELAATLAKLSPEDPEMMPELGPQDYGTVSAFVERTASLDPEMRSGAVNRAIEAAAAAGKPAGSISAPDFYADHRAGELLEFHVVADTDDLAVVALVPRALSRMDRCEGEHRVLVALPDHAREPIEAPLLG